MIKKTILALSLGLISACSFWTGSGDFPKPDYERFIKNVRVISESSSHVTYEYRNLRVDELAVLAAIYCNEHRETQAYLDKIVLQPNHARRAVFICKQRP